MPNTITALYNNVLNKQVQIEQGIVIKANYQKIDKQQSKFSDGETCELTSYCVSENGFAWYRLSLQSKIINA